jgi:hypothetical protein
MRFSITSRPARLRPAAVAGRFYPGDPDDLRNTVARLLEEAPAWKGPVPKAIITPHAGYIYSGPVAASAYNRLRPGKRQIRRVVLLGPTHYVAVAGLGGVTVEGFETPLGTVPVDREALRGLDDLPQVEPRDDAHAPEHSLEVQLPFLQLAFEEFSIVPLVVGEAAPGEVAQVLDSLWGGPETCIVISSDLSHFLNLDEARRVDELTARAIENLAPDSIGEKQACGRTPIQGLLESARRRGMRVERLDLRTSGDTAGPRDRVVGYGAFVFSEN